VDARARGRFRLKPSLAVFGGAWLLFGFFVSGCSSSATGSKPAVTPVRATGVDPSAGCSSPRAPLPAATAIIPFEAAGESGFYLIDGPTTAVSSDPLPLLFDLHGYFETAQEQADITELGAYGRAHGFLTVTPQVQQTVPHWNTTPGSGDRAFLVALIDHIEATQCVDLRRVYMDGYSNGAFMTSSMVCELGGRLAAVATISGVQAPANCHPSRPVPVIAFHGTADPLVPYNGGVTAAAKALPAPDGKGTLGPLLGTPADDGISPLAAPIPTELARWASRNRCATHPTSSKAAVGVTLIAYKCPENDTVELYRENGDGHTWPDSPIMTELRSDLGPTTSTIDPDQLMWAFFRAHPLLG
jgi:polyhydroxybutyrate depolymerase